MSQQFGVRINDVVERLHCNEEDPFMFIQVKPMGDVAKLTKFTQHFLWSLRDTRTDGWFLVDSQAGMMLLCFFYIIFSTYLGPKLMDMRKPFECHKIFATVLFGVTVINLWVHYEFWMSGWATGYKFVCENVDYTINPKSMKMANTCWWFYMMKYLDWSYTIINVLRKKYNRITDQHVIHHASMVLHGWGLVRYAPGGQVTFICLLNTMFHAISFFYFGIATLAPKSQFRQMMAATMKYLNLAELIFVPIHMMLPIVLDCEYPRAIIAIATISAIVYLMLFMKQFCCQSNPNGNSNYQQLPANCEVDSVEIIDSKSVLHNLI